jgi:hypothetical protein
MINIFKAAYYFGHFPHKQAFWKMDEFPSACLREKTFPVHFGALRIRSLDN